MKLLYRVRISAEKQRYRESKWIIISFAGTSFKLRKLRAITYPREKLHPKGLARTIDLLFAAGMMFYPFLPTRAVDFN